VRLETRAEGPKQIEIARSVSRSWSDRSEKSASGQLRVLFYVTFRAAVGVGALGDEGGGAEPDRDSTLSLEELVGSLREVDF